MSYYTTFDIKLQLKSTTPKSIISCLKRLAGNNPSLPHCRPNDTLESFWEQPRAAQIFLNSGNSVDDIWENQVSIRTGSGVVTEIDVQSNGKASREVLWLFLQWLAPYTCNPINTTLATARGEDWDTYYRIPQWHNYFMSPDGVIVEELSDYDLVGAYQF